MMGLEEQLLVASIRETIGEARLVESRVWELELRRAEGRCDDLDHVEGLMEEQDALNYYVDKVFRDVQILAERLGLQAYRKDISKDRRSFSDLSLVTLDSDHNHFSPALRRAINHFSSLETMVLGRELTGVGVFRTVLQNTNRIIDAQKLIPRNEADVRAAIRQVLRFAFGDIRHEIPLPKTLKTYKADIGVPAIMAAAEYKFATTKQAAKQHLDEVYADMKGYSGSVEYRTFFAVLYQTEPWFRQDEVEEEFRLVRAELSWTPVVVTGIGERNPRAKTSSA